MYYGYFGLIYIIFITKRLEQTDRVQAPFDNKKEERILF